MKTILSLTASLLMLASFAHAGDKTGNGGGVWVCSVNNQIQTATLVDFYEAVHEFHWNLQSTPGMDPLMIADQMAMTANSKFSQFSGRWSQILQDVKSKMQQTDGELAIIEDSLWRVRPSKESCPTEWQYVQFANYTNFGTIIVSQQLWQSKALSAQDKAGLLWHEVIYRWMREQYGDTNSVRARQVVGLLFSNMPSWDAQKIMQDILNQSPGPQPEPQPDPNQPDPNKKWICMIKNGVNERYFFDYGALETLAKSSTINNCQSADSNLAFHCQSESMTCEMAQSNEIRFACSVTNGVTQANFSGAGRTKLEAEAKARKACSDANISYAVHCQEPVCGN